MTIYRDRPMRWHELFSWVLPGALAVVLPFGYGWQRAVEAYSRYGPVAAELWSRPWYALAALALLLFLAFSIYRMLIARRFVAVHASGLRLNLPRSRLMPMSRPYTLTWEEIHGVSTDWMREQFFGLPLRTTQRASLYLPQGRPIRLGGGIEDLPELVSQIKARLYPRLLSQMKAALLAGEQLGFGPVIVSSECLHLYPLRSHLPLPGTASAPRDPVPWPRVRSMEARSGNLSIVFTTHNPKGAEYQTCRIPIAHIPNLELLVQLVQQGVKL